MITCGYSAEFYGRQQRQQISELQFDKFLTPSSFLCWKIRFKTQVTTCSDFLSEVLPWIKEVEMIESLDELKSSRSTAGQDFPNFEMLDAKIASALKKLLTSAHFRKIVSVEEQRAQKDDRFLRLRQYYSLLRKTTDSCAWGSIRLCWFVLCYFPWWQHSGIRYKMGRSFIVFVKKKTFRWYLGNSVQIEDMWVWSTQNSIRNVRDGDSSKDIDAQLSKMKRWWKEVWIRNSRCETLASNTGKSELEQSKGLDWHWKRKRYVLPAESQRPMFEGRQVQFLTLVLIVHQNRHRQPLHPLSHQSRESSVRGKSNPDMILRLSCRYFMKGTCTRSPCEYWHPPECQFC